MSYLAAPLQLILLLGCVSAVAGCGGDASKEPAGRDRAGAATTTSDDGDARSDEGERERESEVAPDPELPISQIVGELIMTKLDAATPTDEELRAVSSLQLGGVILFGPNVVDLEQTRELVRQLDAARAPAARRVGLPSGVLVSVDQEGGSIRNVPFAPPEQTQPQLAGDVDAAGDAALATGTALRAAGISIDLGPVADLASGPNRTMAGRAFGSDGAEVAPLVAATVGALQRGGVAAAAKHFPGFGASSANSDFDVARVDSPRADLLRNDLAPFRAAIEAGTEAIMVSHGIYSGMGSSRPAILEPRIVTKLLRDELGFEGVAMTDSMNAKGFRESWGDTVPRACPEALAAGIDLLLLTGTMETARLCRDRILEAVRNGTLPEARVREAFARVTELRERRALGAR